MNKKNPTKTPEQIIKEFGDFLLELIRENYVNKNNHKKKSKKVV